MRNRRERVNRFDMKSPMNDCPSYLRGVQDYLKQIPCVRWEKVVDIQRQMTSGDWPPESDQIADRILFEHLLGPLQP